MDENEEQDLKEALICTILLSSAQIIQANKKKKKNRKVWVRKFLQQRERHGAHIITVNALRENDPYSFRRYLRMSSEVYEVSKIQ